MTVIRTLDGSSDTADFRTVRKYASSSIVPSDQDASQVMKTHGDSVQTVLLQGGATSGLSEEEMAAVMPQIADAISKMDSTEAVEVLPGIKQSITRLCNGGNLVITTMTRHVDEEETEAEEDVSDVNFDGDNVFYVQDSRGEMFYVQDVTEESHGRGGVEKRQSSSSYLANSGLSKVLPNSQRAGGQIEASTAKEIIAKMYGVGDDVHEINENEEEWSERTYEYEIPSRRNKSAMDAASGQMLKNDGDLTQSLALERYQGTQGTANNGLCLFDGTMMAHNSNQVVQYRGDDTNSVYSVTTQNANNEDNKTIERLIIEGEIFEYPEPAPVPLLWFPPPPLCVKTDDSYSLVKVDVTPISREQAVMVKQKPETPIYQTVATIKRALPPMPLPKPVMEVQESHIRFDAQEEEEEMRQESYEETTSRMAMGGNVLRGSYRTEASQVKGKQSLSEFLLQRLSMVDNLDIKQKIDVKHDTINITCDVHSYMNTGDKSYHATAANIYDRVGETVDLEIKEGCARIVVTVTAERVKPGDLEFGIWRSHQAVVTRTIEVRDW